jgi:CRP-like cAMP-binding protein
MSISTRLQNKILEKLPEPDRQRILGQMEEISLPLGEVVAYPGFPPKWVHFPVSAVLSSMVVLENGSTVEGSTIGNEGMDGLYLLAEPLPSPYKINVQVEGDLLRVSAAKFRQILKDSSAMSQLMMRYALVSIERGAQNGACIQHHTVEERMCRWLLETALRQRKDSFHLTQEFLSDMLGVRRQSVNLTARFLQAANIIKYHRSEVTILDRPGLEASSCECFRVTRDNYEASMKCSDTPVSRPNGASLHTLYAATTRIARISSGPTHRPIVVR